MEVYVDETEIFEPKSTTAVEEMVINGSSMHLSWTFDKGTQALKLSDSETAFQTIDPKTLVMFKLELSKFSKQIIWCDSLQVRLMGLNGIKVLSTLTFLFQMNYLLKSAFQTDFPSLPILFINSKDYFYPLLWY